MTDLRTAAQQALEAWDQPHGINYIDFRPYMDALRAALAEPVHEPVAWVYPEGLEALKSGRPWTAYGSNGDGRIPLYLNDAVARRVEPRESGSGAGFESLPASPTQQEPVQEPVAWRTFDGEGGYDYRDYEDNEDYHQEYVKRNGIKYAHWVEPLYAALPCQKPLTEEEIEEINLDLPLLHMQAKRGTVAVIFARAIERAHGIGGQDEY